MTNKIKNEPGVVIWQLRIVILDRSPAGNQVGFKPLGSLGRVACRWLCAEQPDPPIKQSSKGSEQSSKWGGWPKRSQETNLADLVWVISHQVVSGQTQLEHQSKLIALEVFNATPNKVAGFLGCEVCDVALVNQ